MTVEPRRIGLVAYPAAQLLDVAGPADVFAMAARELATRTPAYTLEVLGPSGRPVRTSSTVRLVIDRALCACEPADFDTVLVAGGLGAQRAAKDPATLAWLRRAAALRRLGAVCTGAWLLAEAGLLDGRRAATHWKACDELAKAHPAVTVERDAIFVRDGNVWTSAGITSGIDLALALVEEDHGRALALAIARLLVVYLKRAGGQSQFSVPLAAQMGERSPIRAVQMHAIERPGENLSVEKLAAFAAMSPRHFARVFLRETGVAPGEFVERVRIDAARRLLEDSDLTADIIARRCGFGEPDTMRRAFLRRLGVPPRDYRNRFRSTRWHEAA